MWAGREEGGAPHGGPVGPGWEMLCGGGDGRMWECRSCPPGAHCPRPHERGQAGRGLSSLEVGLQHGKLPSSHSPPEPSAVRSRGGGRGNI